MGERAGEQISERANQRGNGRDWRRLLRPWVLASRPRTLPAAAAPVVVATALAARAGALHLTSACLALCAALLIQIGANYANDLYDHERGADVPGRLGPTRVTSAGLLSPRAVRLGMGVVFGLAGVCGLYLIARGGWPIVVIGLASIAAAVIYTGGPFPIGYHGLGDLFAFLFFGVAAVVGTYYVQALTVSLAAWAAALPMGALVTAILVVNNVRDLETDRAVGKRTLAVILGRKAACVEYALLLAVAYLMLPVFWLGLGMGPWVLLPIVTAPQAIRLARAVYVERPGPVFNRLLAGTAQLLLWYAILFAVGVLL
jgi:1,4-dihydroxy-2-naphthoate octaprenyltransferase